MAREKDEAKRGAILAGAKRLFAAQGFHGTSMSDLAAETGLPVGSIYTYFENKEALIRSVVDSGWGEFWESLVSILDSAPSARARLALVLYRILPSLFEDVDLISILLSEAARYVGLEDKLERLTSLVAGLVLDLSREEGMAMSFPPRQAKAALTLYFLGSLDTVRLSRAAGLGIPNEDVIDFIRLSIENAFRIELGPELAET
jgi:AcrR family transcriptional regulator